MCLFADEDEEETLGQEHFSHAMNRKIQFLTPWFSAASFAPHRIQSFSDLRAKENNRRCAKAEKFVEKLSLPLPADFPGFQG